MPYEPAPPAPVLPYITRRPRTATAALQEERRRAMAEKRTQEADKMMRKREILHTKTSQHSPEKSNKRPVTALVKKEFRHSLVCVTELPLMCRPKSAPVTKLKAEAQILCPSLMRYANPFQAKDCNCERSVMPELTDGILDDVIRLAPRNQLIFIYLPNSLTVALGGMASSFETFLFVTHRSQLKSVTSKPCAHLQTLSFRLFQYVSFDPKSSSLLRSRHGLVPGTFVVYGAGFPLVAGKAISDRQRMEAYFNEQLDRCRLALDRREFLPRDFRFSVA